MKTVGLLLLLAGCDAPGFLSEPRRYRVVCYSGGKEIYAGESAGGLISMGARVRWVDAATQRIIDSTMDCLAFKPGMLQKGGDDRAN